MEALVDQCMADNTTRTAGKTRPITTDKTSRCWDKIQKIASPQSTKQGKGGENRWPLKRTKWKLLLGFAMLAVFHSEGRRTHRTVVKIGIVNSFSGFLAAPGDEMQKGMDPLCQGAHQGPARGGVRIEIIKRDDGTSPEVGQKARGAGN